MAVLHDALSQAACRELCLLAASLPCPGHVACVRAVHAPILARAAPHSLPALLRARDLARDAAEELSGEVLFVEFSALHSWCAGSELGWHDDVSAGEHLSARHWSAVLYLNGEEFSGGDFAVALDTSGASERRFRPRTGSLLVYPSTVRHRVTPVTAGVRVTLAVWLTRDASRAEDPALLRCFDGLTPGVLRAGAGPLLRVPGAFFGSPDARHAALAARGLRVVPLTEDAADGPVSMHPLAGQPLPSPPGFQDVTHALLLATFCELRFGVPLAACRPFAEAGCVCTADVVQAYRAHDAEQREAMSGLLPSWRNTGALFAPKADRQKLAVVWLY